MFFVNINKNLITGCTIDSNENISPLLLTDVYTFCAHPSSHIKMIHETIKKTMIGRRDIYASVK